MDDDQLRATLVRHYHETKGLMFEEGSRDGRTSVATRIKRLIDAHKFVYGVWVDKSRPQEIDYKLLKGDELQAYKQGIQGLACRSSEHADRIKTMFCTPGL